MSKLIVSVILVVVSIGTVLCNNDNDNDLTKPCVAPKVWESKLFESNVEKKYFMRGIFSYDAVNRRERIIDELMIDESREYYDIIYLHNENKKYVFNLHTRKCEVKNITRPWKEFGIPKNAKRLGDSYIGSPEIPRAGK